ncbi:hypothetical protein [Nocardia sp. NPDC057455]|uniref:hypothetical protein n=1 Tax=Nocardia sp. NPDC057455 TaxID=3346138 RepID=UPI003672ACD9
MNVTTFALAQGSDIWPGRFTDIDAARRSADWCTAHYAGRAFRVIDARTGEYAPRTDRGTDVSIGTVDQCGWQDILLDGLACGAAVRITSSGNVLLSMPRHATTTHRNVEAALNSWNFAGMLRGFNA